MNYYVGLLAFEKRFIIFTSTKIPTRKKYHYFNKVFGPFKTEQQVQDYIKILKYIYKYKENPVKCECKGRQNNPGEAYHNKMFLRLLKNTEGLTIGSPDYIATLSKAYEHMHSARESAREGLE